jgi:hypothetical protein
MIEPKDRYYSPPPWDAFSVSNQQLTPIPSNSGRTGGGRAVFASLTRLPLIPWEHGFTR